MKVVVAAECLPERIFGVENPRSPVAMRLISHRTVALPQPLAEFILKPIRAAVSGTGNSPVQ